MTTYVRSIKFLHMILLDLLDPRFLLLLVIIQNRVVEET
jgi:hypothetical protein